MRLSAMASIALVVACTVTPTLAKPFPLEGAGVEDSLCAGFENMRACRTEPGCVWTKKGTKKGGRNICMPKKCEKHVDCPENMMCKKAGRCGDCRNIKRRSQCEDIVCDGVFCNTRCLWKSRKCGPKISDGYACEADGDCRSDFCNSNGTCGKESNGRACKVDGDCRSDFCNSNGTCGKQSDGHACERDGDCRSNVCNSRGTCGKQSDGHACERDGECRRNVCNSRGTCGKQSDGDACESDGECRYHFCNSKGTCGTLVNGEECNVADDCRYKQCFSGYGYGGKYYCAPEGVTSCMFHAQCGAAPRECSYDNCGFNFCINLFDGDRCGMHKQCESNFCNSQNTCGKLDPGQECRADRDCKYNFCNSQYTCGKLDPNQDCRVDRDCKTGLCSFRKCVDR